MRRTRAPRVARSRADRLVAGVAGGLGTRFAIDPVLVRLAFVFLSVAAFAGPVLYAAAWLAMAEPQDDFEAPAARTSTQQAVAFGLIVLGAALSLRRLGLWFGDGLAVAVGLGVLGSAVLHGRGDRASESWLSGRRGDRALADLVAGTVSPARALGGTALVALGAVTFLVTTADLAGLRDLMLALVTAVAGLTLLLGPLAWRAAKQLIDERGQRIRSEERAEVAAHLHDSVLQTLALIQRAEDPRRMVALARRQERELRSWLYTGPPASTDTLEAAFGRLVEDVETEHAVAVDLVVVGDRRIGPNAEALVRAAHEAVRNAARHAGGPVSVYVEADTGGVSAYVRDRGPGFSLEAVPDDRRGVRDSIVRRIERRGGRVEIESGPDGTEVGLWVPRGEDGGPGSLDAVDRDEAGGDA